MKLRPDRWRSAVVSVILASQLVCALAPATAFAQTAPAKPANPPSVARGQEYYEQARFDEAITLLRGLVDRGQLAGEDLQKARELLARAYVKKGYPTQGKEVFKAILQANSEWRPDPIRVPPDETAVFEQALKEFQSENAAPAPAVTTPAEPEKPAPKPEKVKAEKPPKEPKAQKPPKEPKPPKPPKEARPDKPAKPVEAISEEGGKKKSKTLWYVVGGAAVVGGVAAAAAGGGGKKSEAKPLGGFPATP